MGFNMHEITTDRTKQLCRFIKTLQYEDIPPAVIERAKMMVMQTVGVSLCSTELKQVQDAIAIAKEMSPGSEGTATLWADGAKVSWEAAALAAGTMGDTLDWEDCSVTGHPSAGVIPTAVIASEVLHKSGKDLLTAVVVGYEVYQRVALAGRSNIVGYNIFGNLAVLMKLLDLSEEQMNQAFGVGTACAIIPANVHEITMSDSLNYLYGFRAESTITMIKTVLEGIENMEDAFDDPSAYLAHCGYQEPEWLTLELGEHWMMMDMLLVKHWPANVFVQTYAELAARLVTKYHFNPDDVEEIIVRPSIAFRTWYTDTGYESITQAQFSIPYAVACAMYHPDPGAVWYQPDTMKNPKIILSDVSTGSPVAIVGATHITTMRTAGGHGVVQAKHLANPDPSILSVFGCGAQARAGMRGFLEGFPSLRQVRLFSRSRQPMEEARKELEDRVEVVLCDTPEDALAGSQLVLMASGARTTLVTQEMLRPGMTIIGIEGFRDLAPQIAKSADKWYLGYKQPDAHILNSPTLNPGHTLTMDDVLGDMTELLTGKIPGREREDEIIVSTHMGMGAHDVSCAATVYQRAREQQVGQWLTLA